jgi:DNA-directed RNA polymerase specialized sigma subunit
MLEKGDSMISYEQMMAKLSVEEKELIAARSKDLIEEEMTLHELRKAHKMTQKNLAASLGVEQAHISRMEKRSDLLLSTLRSYVEAMGGTLKLVAEFPNKKAVILHGISAME